MAMYYKLSGDLNNALIWFKKALEIDNDTWTVYGIATIYADWNDKTQSFEWLKKAIDLSPETVIPVAATQDHFQKYHGDPDFERLISSHHLPTQTSIGIFMFHSITPDVVSDACISPNDFEAEMKWLYDKGYETLSLDEFYTCLQSKSKFPSKSVILTFDDGYDNNYTTVYPILKKYNFKATIFMSTDFIDKPGYLTKDQLKTLDQNGIRIESHTKSHRELYSLSLEEQKAELTGSQKALQVLGRNVEYLCFPTGKYNNGTVTLMQQLGYKIGFKMSGGKIFPTDNPLTLNRFYAGSSLDDFINKVKQTN